MSNKYKHGDTVPSDVLCARLDELAKVVTQGRDAVAREFTMRVPAEMDYDADLVLSAASRRIAELECPTCNGTREVETDNNGPIVDCPLCIPAKSDSDSGNTVVAALAFGDYITVEQKRYGAPNEMYQYKVIRTLDSNSYAKVPVDAAGNGDRSECRSETVPVVQCICCGIDETRVVRFRVEDVQRMAKPDNSPSVMVDREDLQELFDGAEFVTIELLDRIEVLLHTTEGEG